MVTISKSTPIANVELTTKDGREFSAVVECTEEVKQEAQKLALSSGSRSEERSNVWDVAKSVEVVFNQTIAREVISAYVAGKSTQDIAQGFETGAGLWGLFVFAETPQGSEFWIGLTDAAEEIINA